ncbi:antitoxin of toxin-antitoxin stability system [Nitratireductor sp. XY-223]|uniref:antitoxin of toxin-antitoxin stability system n=1 Tax=Nitratireductor sp. XY-223 TaxID=2561926 RepID=UPI0010AB0AAE|nr:antitoxin of toxin-antitoxin stability system [Nitratireductor sp. XY-223]
MPTTIKTTVFTFDELTEAVRERARAWYREGNLDYDWWSFVYDDFSTICAILGVELATRPVRLMGGGTRREPCIRFQGFGGQGDGASFEGMWIHVRGSVARIKAHAPKDGELHDIAKRLANIQRRNFFQPCAHIGQRGYHCHENTMQIPPYRSLPALRMWCRKPQTRTGQEGLPAMRKDVLVTMRDLIAKICCKAEHAEGPAPSPSACSAI